MGEEGGTRAIRFVLDDEVYKRVRHAAVDEYTNATAWIRDAIARKLDGVPEDGRLAEVCGAWQAMGEDGRAALLTVAKALAASEGRERPLERQ